MSGNSRVAALLNLDEQEAAFAKGWGVPTAWYVSDELYELEKDCIFACQWQYVGRASSLLDQGDVILGQVADVPVMVTRDETGHVRGFVNACRHRGYPVVRSECRRKMLTCEYHSWSYGLDGRLIRAPGSEDEEHFESSELSLLPVSVDSWGELIFVNLAEGAPPYSTAHPEVDSCASDKGVDKAFSDYVFHERRTYDIHANWKLFYDNDIECYHCPTIHPSSFNEAYVTVAGEFEHYTSADGDLMGHRFEPRPIEHGADDADALRSGNYRSLRAFPGLTIAQQDDIALITQIVPTATNLVRYVADFYAEKGAQSNRVAQWVDMLDQTFREDAAVCERQHATLVRSGIGRNRLLASREPGVIWVRDNIWRALKARYRNADL